MHGSSGRGDVSEKGRYRHAAVLLGALGWPCGLTHAPWWFPSRSPHFQVSLSPCLQEERAAQGECLLLLPSLHPCCHAWLCQSQITLSGHCQRAVPAPLQVSIPVLQLTLLCFTPYSLGDLGLSLPCRLCFSFLTARHGGVFPFWGHERCCAGKKTVWRGPFSPLPLSLNPSRSRPARSFSTTTAPTPSTGGCEVRLWGSRQGGGPAGAVGLPPHCRQLQKWDLDQRDKGRDGGVPAAREGAAGGSGSCLLFFCVPQSTR